MLKMRTNYIEIADKIKLVRRLQYLIVQQTREVNEPEKTMKSIFVRIQKNGLGWNPEHKSYRPPANWKIGYVIDPTEGTLTEGMAAFHLPHAEFEKFVNGEDFTITDRESNPNVLDWEECGRDEFIASDALAADYEYLVFTGETIEQLPDGWIVKPLAIENVLPDTDMDVCLDQPLVGGRRSTRGGESAAVENPLPEEMKPLPKILF